MEASASEAPPSGGSDSPVSAIKERVDQVGEEAKRQVEQATNDIDAAMKEDMSEEEAAKLIEGYVNGLRENISKALDEIESILKEKLHDMTPEQRRKAVAISEETKGFFSGLLGFLNIVKGCQRVQKATKNIFKTKKP